MGPMPAHQEAERQLSCQGSASVSAGRRGIQRHLGRDDRTDKELKHTLSEGKCSIWDSIGYCERRIHIAARRALFPAPSNPRLWGQLPNRSPSRAAACLGGAIKIALRIQNQIIVGESSCRSTETLKHNERSLSHLVHRSDVEIASSGRVAIQIALCVQSQTCIG